MMYIMINVIMITIMYSVKHGLMALAKKEDVRHERAATAPNFPMRS